MQISTKTAANHKLYGSLEGAGRPANSVQESESQRLLRDQNSQWDTSRTSFADEEFPTFAVGCAYLLSSAALKSISSAACEFPLFNLEDVHWTGILRSRANVSRVYHVERHLWNCMRTKPFTADVYSHVLVSHHLTAEQLRLVDAAAERALGPAERAQNWAVANRQQNGPDGPAGPEEPRARLAL